MIDGGEPQISREPEIGIDKKRLFKDRTLALADTPRSKRGGGVLSADYAKNGLVVYIHAPDPETDHHEFSPIAFYAEVARFDPGNPEVPGSEVTVRSNIIRLDKDGNGIRYGEGVMYLGKDKKYLAHPLEDQVKQLRTEGERDKARELSRKISGNLADDDQTVTSPRYQKIMTVLDSLTPADQVVKQDTDTASQE